MGFLQDEIGEELLAKRLSSLAREPFFFLRLWPIETSFLLVLAPSQPINPSPELSDES